MFAATFAFALVVTHVAAEIPSYIHICNRKDPNLEKCILDNIDNLKEQICIGIPELDVPPVGSISIDKESIIDTDITKVVLQDARLSGLCDFEINSFHIDLDKPSFDVALTFKRLIINGTYEIDAHVLVPITLKQLVSITTDNVSVVVSTDMKIVTKDGVRYMYLPKMTLNLDIKGYDIEFAATEQTKQFNEVFASIFGKNQKEIIGVLKPTLERIITTHVLDFSNKIVTHFTYDEIFPDRT